MLNNTMHILAIVIMLVASSVAHAAERFITVPLPDLTIENGELPDTGGIAIARLRNGDWTPRVVVEHAAEAYVAFDPTDTPWAGPVSWGEARLAIRTEHDGPVRGQLFVIAGEAKETMKLAFTLADPQGSDSDEDRVAFLGVKERFYDGLHRRGLPGGAWFRYQARDARAERIWRSGETSTTEEEEVDQQAVDWQRLTSLERSYGFFVGGRALSENLDLDHPMLVDDAAGEAVDIKTIEGITTPEMDFSQLVTGEVEADPLATLVPADLYAVFFPTFDAMVNVIDEMTERGTPVLRLLEPRAENAHVRERYETQLALPLDTFARMLGAKLVRSAAFIGSDPYLRVGSDVALIMESDNPSGLLDAIVMRQRLGAQIQGGVQVVTETIGELEWSVARSSDRVLCSYVTQLEGAVVVTNSPALAGRIAETAHGGESIATLDEYRYFRQEYPIADESETAFFVVPDAAIRRWASPTWRIAASRRSRAGAVLADLQARHAMELVDGAVTPRDLRDRLPVRSAGTIRLEPGGVIDSAYGSVLFMTPIAELPVEMATEAERDAYDRFRRQYQRRWTRAFDPIGGRLVIGADTLALDMSVIPLTISSDYQGFVELTNGVTIPPEAYANGQDAMIGMIVSLNPESELVRFASGFARAMAPDLDFDPLAWIGDSAAVWLEPDPFLTSVMESDDPEDELEDQLNRLPIFLSIDVRSSIRATAFLAFARSYLDTTAPDMLLWETKKHEGQSYVVISPSETSDEPWAGEPVMCYRLTGDRLLLTPREDLLQRTIDREIRAAAGDTPGVEPARGHEGQHVVIRVRQGMARLVDSLSRDQYQEAMQRRSWAALPILTDWKLRRPDLDPMAAHRQLWGVTLVCPAGGSYVWDERFMTYRSTVCGDPGVRGLAPDASSYLADFERAEVGFSFIHDGLRVRATIHRAP